MPTNLIPRYRAIAVPLIMLLLVLGTAQAALITYAIDYSDGAGEGFNDPTLGAQRRASFEAATAIWAQSLEGTIPIKLTVSFDTTLPGSANSATLGRAGATTYVDNVVGGLNGVTFYPLALANQIESLDITPLVGETHDISAQFNSNVDGPVVLGDTSFSYRTSLEDPIPGGTIDFLGTALHELGHGFGFLSLVNADGTLPNVDIYTTQLAGISGQTVTLLTSMNDAQRLAAITSIDELFWIGPVVQADRDGPVPMYAPDPYEPSSSVGHWDTVLTPNELMEPFETGDTTGIGLTKQALVEIGWKVLNFESRLVVAGPSNNVYSPHIRVTLNLTSNSAGGNVNVERIGGEPATLLGQDLGSGPVQAIIDVWEIKGLGLSNKSATITFSYTDQQLLDAGVVAESQLLIFKSADGGFSWTEIPSTVDAGANTITTSNPQTSFSLWAVGVVPVVNVAENWTHYN